MILESIIRIFGEMSYLDLLSITTSNNTPWERINNQNELRENNLNDVNIISKNETRNWFRDKFNIND